MGSHIPRCFASFSVVLVEIEPTYPEGIQRHPSMLGLPRLRMIRRRSSLSRLALITDIHANADALRAVLTDIAQDSVDRIICLGDIVGYGPDPAECVDTIATVCDIVLQGNHDEAVASPHLDEQFNDRARISLAGTREMLDDDQIAYLSNLPATAHLQGLDLTHATFGDFCWEYVYEPDAAARSFAGMRTNLGVFGHTHVPMIITRKHTPLAEGLDPRGTIDVSPLIPNAIQRIPEHRITLINPGSVGQPRDRNPDASYAILDTEHQTVQLKRVEYNVHAVAKRIRALGFPQALSDRLLVGA